MKTTNNAPSSTPEFLIPHPARIVVIGGSGLIGRQVVDNLRRAGHEALSASPTNGVNTLTGEGLAEALRGAFAVVDVSNSPSFEDQAAMSFFKTSTSRLVDESRAAGVRHFVALSVVGTDRLQAAGYFRAKQVQENLITQSGLPFTIVRATQFFEFISSIAHAATVDNCVRLSPAMMQPIASTDVASAVAEVALSSPLNALVDLAGPQPMRMPDMVNQYLQAQGDARQVVVDAAAGYFGTPVTDRSLVPEGQSRLGKTTLSDWILHQSAQAWSMPR